MSTTTKNVAKAIAILSDVLSAEVENEPCTNVEEVIEEETEETIALDEYEGVVEKSEEFSADILDDLQNLRDDLALHIDNNEDEDYDSSFGEWDEGDDEDDDESTDEATRIDGSGSDDDASSSSVGTDDDASTASDAASVADAATDSVSESDSDKIEELESKVAELQDVITDAADTLNDIISNVEDFNSDTESW